MTDHFALLRQQIPDLTRLSDTPGEVGFLCQEALRFCSLAGTLGATFELTNGSAEERQITHTIARSLLENFFWLIYIFDDHDQRHVRYNEKIDQFKIEYSKLLNDPLVPRRDQLEPADPAWADLRKRHDVKSMLDQVRNDHGDRLGYLYLVYRISSFDTHGNSMAVFFEASFGKQCKFMALDLTYGFDLVANQYLVILGELQARGEI